LSKSLGRGWAHIRHAPSKPKQKAGDKNLKNISGNPEITLQIVKQYDKIEVQQTKGRTQ